jgi:hypothetical protein
MQNAKDGVPIEVFVRRPCLLIVLVTVGSGPQSRSLCLPAMSDQVMELLSTPCFVRKLHIVGNRRTKRALIEAELRAALAARTHEDLAVELALASHRLKDLDVFKSASCEVDVLPEGGPGDVLVSLKVIVILFIQKPLAFLGHRRKLIWSWIAGRRKGNSHAEHRNLCSRR